MIFKRQLILIKVSRVLCLLVAAACQIRSAEFPVPTKVVGVYRYENCAPRVASALAVEMFNTKKSSLKFSFESVHGDVISNLLDTEIKDRLNNSVIVTGESSVCERLSKILVNMSSFLVCHGIATTETFLLLESQPKLYLSRPNPEALEHCLFRLIKLIIDNQNTTSKASFIFDEDHPYSHVGLSLIFSLQSSYLRFKEVFNVISSPNDHIKDWLPNEDLAKNATVINAILQENEARDLLCNFFHSSQSNENRSLIFVGLSKGHWLQSADNPENSEDDASSLVCGTGNLVKHKHDQIKCNQHQLRNAAEGHLLLEYPRPPWLSSENEDWNITSFRRFLKERLENTSATISFDEAPLALDSVWGILRAINSAFKGNGQVSGESVGQALITEPFTGLTGEKLSFIRYGNGNGGYVRSKADATIAIYRFENGEYVPIGQHFNANSSFHWLDDHSILNGRATWKPICPNESSQNKCCRWIPLIAFLFLLLTLLFYLCWRVGRTKFST